MSLPERSATPRDDRTGWERSIATAKDWCPCGRVATVRGQCARCLHGLCRGVIGKPDCNGTVNGGGYCDDCHRVIGGYGTVGT